MFTVKCHHLARLRPLCKVYKAKYICHNSSVTFVKAKVNVPARCLSSALNPKPQPQEPDKLDENLNLEDLKLKEKLIKDENEGVFVKNDSADEKVVLNENKPVVEHINVIEEEVLKYKKFPKHYSGLAKARLTGLVVATAAGGFALAPGVFEVSSFLACTVGTCFISSAANTFNQVLEIPYDAQMNRTKHRVMVKGHLTRTHAVTFGLICTTLGLSVLSVGTNPLTFYLGAANVILYSLVYTPLKRISIANTWVGSVVGAIPPVMGWVACTGTIDAGALLVGAILFAWQFPHFNALSWNLKADYNRAGYKMMSVSHPDLCKRTAFSYSVLTIPICTLCPVADMTTWMFAFSSLPVNAYLSYLGWKFYKSGDSKSSRELFRFSLIHLPLILMLMIISKKNLSKKESEVL